MMKVPKTDNNSETKKCILLRKSFAPFKDATLFEGRRFSFVERPNFQCSDMMFVILLEKYTAE